MPHSDRRIDHLVKSRLVNLAYGFIFSFAGYAAWLVATQVSKNPFLIAARHRRRAAAGIIICLLVFILCMTARLHIKRHDCNSGNQSDR